MKVNDKLEQTNVQNYHYVMLGFADFKKIFKKLEGLLKFYRIENKGKEFAKEIIYDVPDNLLSDAGIVLSKRYETKRIFLNVRKISKLPGEMKRPSKKFILGELESDIEPRNYSLQISSAIENSFSTTFTVDLDSIVKQTIPKIEININSNKYHIIGGTGFRADFFYEIATYKDIKTGKKVDREGVTLQLSNNKEYEEENKQILDLIDRQIKELALYNLSRFEIAQMLLYPKVVDDDENRFDDEDKE